MFANLAGGSIGALRYFPAYCSLQSVSNCNSYSSLINFRALTSVMDSINNRDRTSHRTSSFSTSSARSSGRQNN